MGTKGLAVLAAALTWVASAQESSKPRPWGTWAREVQSAQIVAFDGREVLRRDLNQEQSADDVHVDFDLVDADGDLLGWGRESVFAHPVGDRPGIVRQFLLFDPKANVGFAPVEGEPFLWFRQSGMWGPVEEHEGLFAVRRAKDGTLVVDSLGAHPMRMIVHGTEWSHELLDLFPGEFTKVIAKPSEEILRRARAERQR
ncbi:MAG: hypothetical protein AAGI22_14245 [Planctomycetota bacterium]